MNLNKKGIGMIISTVLILIVSVSAMVGIGSWIYNIQNNLNLKSHINSNSYLDILGIERNSVDLYNLSLKVKTSSYLIINKIQVDGIICDNFDYNVLLNGYNKFEINCTGLNVNLPAHTIDVFTNNKLVSKSLKNK